MVKRVIIALVAVAVIGVAFISGGMLEKRKSDNEFKASVAPASTLINNLTGGNNIDESYNSTSDVYRSSTNLEAFKATAELLKDGVLESNATYVGDADTINSYTIVKVDKTYDVVIGTTKSSGKWSVISLSVSEKIRQ